MKTCPNYIVTLSVMALIAMGVVWIIYPDSFFSNFHEIIDDIIFSFLNTVVLGYGLGFIERRIRISWVTAPFKRFIVSVVVYMIFVFVMSNLIFIVEYVIILRRAQFPFEPMTYLQIARIPLIVAFIIGGFFTSKAFLENWRRNAIELERLEKEKIKAQYDALKNQVNPHFLFNSLNALSSLVYENREQAVHFIRKLSDVYRYVLDVQGEEVVSLNQELSFVNAYYFLQKIRFGENIHLEVSMSDNNHDKYLPPLALQMLMENAYKHNEISGDFPLTIEIRENEGYLEIRNNINPKINVDSSGVGLQNLQMRYKRLTSKEIIVDKTSETFSVRIPVLQQ